MASDTPKPKWPWNAQRSRERPAALREIEAGQIGMQVCPPPWHSTVNIGYELTTNYHHTHQVAPHRPGTAPYAGAKRLRTARRHQSIPLRPRSGCQQLAISGPRAAS